MSALSNEDYYLARIRQKLKDDGVKLWEAPYYVDNQTNESLFQVSFYYFQLLNRNIILKIIVSSGIGFQFFWRSLSSSRNGSGFAKKFAAQRTWKTVFQITVSRNWVGNIKNQTRWKQSSSTKHQYQLKRDRRISAKKCNFYDEIHLNP